MTRWFVTAIAVTLLLASARTVPAQVRTGGGVVSGGSPPRVVRPAPSRPRHDRPAPKAPFTSGLRFVGPPPEPGRILRPTHVGLGWGSFGLFTFWPYGSFQQTLPNNQIREPLPAGTPTGGVQLDVLPRRAQVYVDGIFVGVVDDFAGYYRHLELVAGPHEIAIVAPDYEPLVFELKVSPNRTTTHRAELARAYGR